MVNFGGTDNFPNAPNESVGPMLTADRIKLFADGALGASTAALSVNYKNKVNFLFDNYKTSFYNFCIKSF